MHSNKRSVYDRGIEPSGNAHQYPFKASPQRVGDERQSVAEASRPRASETSSRATFACPIADSGQQRGQSAPSNSRVEPRRRPLVDRAAYDGFPMPSDHAAGFP